MAFFESLFLLGDEEVDDVSSTPYIGNDDTLLDGDIILLHSGWYRVKRQGLLDGNARHAQWW